MRKVVYNSQRDNFDFNHQFKASCQCFATSAWMFMSWYDDKIHGDDDTALKDYVDNVSDAVGSPGIGERIKRKFAFITGNAAYWWQVHKAAIEERLCFPVQFRDGDMTLSELTEAVRLGPVIIGTSKLGGLPGGHIILLVDTDGINFYANDPYGNAYSRYSDTHGANVCYPIEWFVKFIGNGKGSGIRAILK